MKISIPLLLTLLMLSCNKELTIYDTQTVAIQLCNSEALPYNSPFAGQCIWDIYNVGSNTLLSSVSWNNNCPTISLTPGTYRINNYGVTITTPIDTFIHYCDTSLSFSSGKVYSLFNLLGRSFTGAQTYTMPNIASLVQENDTVSPPTGFAKIRLIVGVPIIGSTQSTTSSYSMNPSLVFYDNNKDTLKYGQDRYYLDHLNNSSLLNFTTVPAGSYNQLGTNIISGGFAFTLESGKKYTIMVTQMLRTQYPSLDQFFLVKHSF